MTVFQIKEQVTENTLREKVAGDVAMEEIAASECVQRQLQK